MFEIELNLKESPDEAPAFLDFSDIWKKHNVYYKS